MLRAVIIDDEDDCRQAVLNLVQMNCPGISIAGEAGSVKQGVDLIYKERPDLLFLDIKLADGTAFNILEELKDYNFHIIFITAYDHYAIQAIQHSAIDYLLKPIDAELFCKAVDKVNRISLNIGLLTKQIKILLENRNDFNRIALPTLEGFRFVNLDDIICCQSDSNYTWFFMKNSEKILVTRTLKEYEETLSDNYFIRIHQSYLINIRYVEKYIKGEGGSVIMADGSEVPVSKRKKEYFLKKFQRLV